MRVYSVSEGFGFSRQAIPVKVSGFPLNPVSVKVLHLLSHSCVLFYHSSVSPMVAQDGNPLTIAVISPLVPGVRSCDLLQC